MKKRESVSPEAEWSPHGPRALPGPVEIGRGRTRVRLQPVAQGRDLVVLITGGTAHVGAVAVCDGRDPAPARLLALPAHREGPLAVEAAEAMAAASGRTCAAVVGIHQDEASRAEIAAIVANVRSGLRCLAGSLQPKEPT